MQVDQMVNMKVAIAERNVAVVALNGFDVANAMKSMESIRKQGAEYFEKYEIRGRKALTKLMADVYGVWHAAKSSDSFETFMNGIRDRVKRQGVEIRASSKDSSLLVRYVFERLSDKQVHVLGRSLDVALSRQTPAAAFEDLVNGTEGGFEGLRAIASSSGSANPQSPAVALSACQAEPTIDTTPKLLWKSGQQVQVFLAVRNDDDTADLKDAYFTKEESEGLLKRFLGNKKRLEKHEKARASAQVLSVVAELESNFDEQSQRVAQLELELRIAERDGFADPALLQRLERERIFLEARKASLDAVRKAAKQ